MEEFIKQKRNEGFSEKVAREFYIDMKEERDRQDRINERERDRQDRIDKEEKRDRIELKKRKKIDRKELKKKKENINIR